jgi:hypothetical protein
LNKIRDKENKEMESAMKNKGSPGFSGDSVMPNQPAEIIGYE